jgi:OST-HTH/LOTUS domain-containing protein
VRRALKILSDREVSPQLGLLKSTLLQLDSTFSERTYGVGSFRDFAQKLANAGHVRLREHGRNVLVELADGNGHLRAEETSQGAGAGAGHHPETGESHRDAHGRQPQQADSPTPAAGEPRAADGIRAVRRIFQAAPNPPRFPMYVRQAKQFMRAVDPQFDERQYGFGTLQDLLRACQREGLFRIERDRQGVIRLFPGNIMQPSTGVDDEEEDLQPEVQPQSGGGTVGGWADEAGAIEAEPVAAGISSDPDEELREDARRSDVVDGDVVQELDVQQVVDGEEAPAAAEEPRRGRGSRKRASGQPRAAKKESAVPRARKAPARSRTPRARKTTPSE